MYKRVQHIITGVAMLFSFMQVKAQIAMPDTVCTGTTRLYHVNDATVPSAYTWKIDGVTQTSVRNEINITWNTAGVFQLTVQEHPLVGCDGDIRSGLVHVIPPPVPNAGLDAIVCFGNTVRLNGSGGALFQWSPPAWLSNTTVANPIVSIPVAGTYNYVLNVSTINGCRSLKSDTVSVTILPPVKVFAGRDTSISINQLLQLNAIDVTNSGFNNYSWSPSFGLNNSTIKNPVASFNSILGNDGITYIVTARNAEGCVARDDINVKVFARSEIYVPTAFTPNGDGLNDFAVVIPVGIKELKYFSIYSRWGELVFRTSDPSKGWDGFYNGHRQDGNVFVWEAEAIDFKGNIIRRKGTVTLIR